MLAAGALFLKTEGVAPCSLRHRSSQEKSRRYEVLPCPRATTHHGVLDEVSSVFTRTAVKRKWWTLLVEDRIYFYRSQQNPTAEMAWPLWKMILKPHLQTGVLELKHADRTMLVSHGDAAQRKKWFDMVRGNMESIKLKGAPRTRRRSLTRRPSVSDRRPSLARRPSMVAGMAAHPGHILDTNDVKALVEIPAT